MKKYFYTIVGLLIVSSLSAQVTVIISPSEVHEAVSPDSFEVIAHAFVKNNATTEKTFEWNRYNNCITQPWTTAVCDKNACYSPTTSHKQFTLAAGEEGILDVHVKPNGANGYAQVDVIVKEVDNETNSDTASYYFNECTTATTQVTPAAVLISPNPTNGFFTLTQSESIKQVLVYNLIGKLVKNFSATPAARYDISNLPDGVYLVQMRDAKGQIAKTVKVVKQ